MKIPWWAVVLVVALGIAVAMYLHAASVARSNGLRADSLIAIVDTTRFENGVWQRRALQSEITADSLDKLLKLKPRVVTVIAVHFDTLRLTDTAAVVEVDSTRHATFDRREPPFTAHAEVSLPKPPAPGTLALRIVLDSIPIALRLGCGQAVGGVKSASVSVSSPPWAQIGLSQPQVDPIVCNAPALMRIPGLRLPFWTMPAAGVVGFLAGVILIH